jgi:hypothetical protein
MARARISDTESGPLIFTLARPMHTGIALSALCNRARLRRVRPGDEFFSPLLAN